MVDNRKTDWSFSQFYDQGYEDISGVIQGCWLPDAVNCLPAELEKQVMGVRAYDVILTERKTLCFNVDFNLLFDISAW